MKGFVWLRHGGTGGSCPLLPLWSFKGTEYRLSIHFSRLKYSSVLLTISDQLSQLTILLSYCGMCLFVLLLNFISYEYNSSIQCLPVELLINQNWKPIFYITLSCIMVIRLILRISTPVSHCWTKLLFSGRFWCFLNESDNCSRRKS